MPPGAQGASAAAGAVHRRLRMGAFTGVLAGVVTAVTGLLCDLAGGGGLDAASAAAAPIGLPGAAGATLVFLVGLPLLATLVGLALALLPPSAAGSGAGLALGIAIGLVATLALSLAPAGAHRVAPAPVALGALGGLVAGFLYSRYARTLRRPPSSRPFPRR